MKSVIVLGATGRLGGETAVYLKNKGYEVTAVGHRPSDNGFFATKGIKFIGNFCIENPESFMKLPAQADAVVHLAGTMPGHADASPMPYINSIIIGMVNLCEWIRTTNIRRVIFNTTPSDVCAHFGTDIPVKDDAVRSFPKDGGDHAIYAIAKNAAVDILEHYAYSDGISSCVLRHLSVYSYHPNPYYKLNGTKKFLPWRHIMEKAISGEVIEVWGDPERKKELLYVKDFAEAVRCALESDYQGIINISGYRPYTMFEQIDGLRKAFAKNGHMSPLEYCPDKPDTPQNLLDSSKARTILGWKPSYDWYSACEDIRKELEEEPFALMWGHRSDFL